MYLNDILIYSKDMESHQKHVWEVVCGLQLHKLFAKLEKCKFYSDSGYAWVNPRNLWPVFTQDQLANSLRATYLKFPVLRVVAIIDIETIHSNIMTALPSDPITQAHVSDTAKSWWSVTQSSFHWLDQCIYVLDVEDLHLRVLQNKHDHPISSHYGQNQTMDLLILGVCAPLIVLLDTFLVITSAVSLYG